MKRKTKAETQAALLQRLKDIFAGSAGYILDIDGDTAGPEQLERILPVCKDIFKLDSDSYLLSLSNLGKWESPQSACDFLFDAGVRA